MPARFDLSALSRRRSAKFALASLAAIVVITLVTFSARAWRNKTGSAARQDAVAAQPAAAPTPERPRYVQRARLGLRLRERFKVLGDRLERPGKERLTMVGTLTRQSGSPAPFRLIMESPGLMRLEEQVGAQLRIIGFDGIGGWKLGDLLGGLFKDVDQEVIETLAFDSADRFFFGQAQGLPTRYLGPRFRLGRGPAATYTGPYYDIYEVIDRINAGPAVREQPKHFHFNSDTQLLERVQYQIKRGGSPVRIEVRLSGYRKVNDQQLPGLIDRIENGASVLKLTISSATVAPRVADGIFTKP